MTLHFIIFSIISLFAFSDLINVKRNQRAVLLMICYIILVAFSGLRYFPNQQDYGEYSKVFTDVATGTKYEGYFEPGYVIMMNITAWFSSHFTFFFTITAFIGIGLNFIGIKRYMPKYIFVAILFYFVHTYIMREMGAIRAGVAAGICFLSLRYVEESKPYKFILATILAMCFHLSAIAFFLIYPFYKLKLSSTKLLILVGICLVVGTIMPFGQILASLPFISNFSRVAGYAQELSGALGIWTNPTTLKQLTFAAIGLIFYKRLEERVPHYRIIIVPYVLSVSWLMVWNDFPIIAGRLAMYFSITEVVLIPCFLMLFTKQSRPIVLAVLVVLAFAILYLNGITFLTPDSGYYPYRTIFSQ